MSYIERVRSFAQLFGNTFAGGRDLYKVLGYKTYVTYQDMYARVERQDISGRIVSAEPDATWSAPPTITGETVAFEQEFKDVAIQHNLWQKLNKADKLIGIGKYSLIVIGVNDGKSLDEPVVPGSASEVLYIKPYSEISVQIQEYDDDTSSPNYGRPLFYRVTPNKLARDSSGTSTGSFHPQAFNVHYSRAVHISEGGLEDDIFGIPRLLKVYNLLEDMVKAVGGSAETFWLTGNRGLQVDVDKDMDLKSEDAAALSDEIDEYFHNLRRVIRTKGVTVNPIGSDVADPRGVFGVIVALLSGATGIPQRILLGSEAGQLASEQDRANWATRITERRSLLAEPIFLRPFVGRLVEMGVVSEPGELTFEWPDAFRQNPLERSQTAAQKARSLANVSKALSDTIPVVSVEEGREIIGVKGPLPAGVGVPQEDPDAELIEPEEELPTDEE